MEAHSEQPSVLEESKFCSRLICIADEVVEERITKNSFELIHVILPRKEVTFNNFPRS